MLKHTFGILAAGIFLTMAGNPSVASAQLVTQKAVQDAEHIHIPAQWDPKPLEMAPKSDKTAKIRIGRLELDRRTSSNDTPWKPQPPYFLRSHTALSMSFDVHLRDR